MIANVSQKDPTRTLTLRNMFVSQMNRRFRELQTAIRQYIIRDNRLDGITTNAPFEYRYASEKHAAFMAWLDEQEQLGILQRTRQIVPYRTVPADMPWINEYIWTAYNKGLAQGRMELRAAGIDVPVFARTADFISSPLFHMPFHAEAIGLVFTRAFTDLKGVTDAMDTQISRVLASGMAEGLPTEQIARNINNRVQKIGMPRARTLARTEVVHAYNGSRLNDFEGMESIIEEEILVKWWTALDERVRHPRHTRRHAKIYRKNQARRLLGEPNCRCVLLPYMVSVHGPVRRRNWGPVNPMEGR